MLPPWKKSAILQEIYKSKLEMYIFMLEMYIFMLEMYISNLKI